MRPKRDISRLLRAAPATLIAACCALCSCSYIDEDLTDCGTDMDLTYSLSLTTNIVTELQTELTTTTEVALGQRLQQQLANVFRRYANDVDLSFYTNDSLRAHHEQHTMNAGEASYTLYLPVNDYHHLALANIAMEQQVDYVADSHVATAMLLQHAADTLRQHTAGLFTARKEVNISDTTRHFDVRLYMANCACALVLRATQPERVRQIDTYVTGVANAFSLSDSTYHFTHNPIIRTEQLDIGDLTDSLFCQYTVCFPSHDALPAAARATGDVTDDDAGLWQIHCYVTLPDGSVTRNVLNIGRALRAGNLNIVKAVINTDGTLKTVSPQVGVSVTLDWRSGGTYTPDL
ncbi:MAG: FimB/Mfa2 family fimbrial subunit [Prevotella sp.]|nr:FimB/Mfa2 family fimbrial subunit [Prevotella sp.]